MSSTNSRRLATLAAGFLMFTGMLALSASAVAAQGVEVKTGARVFFGTAAQTTQPATIDFDKVREATPEWQTIRRDGVQKGSARYQLLMSELNKRVKKLCKKVAQANAVDFVVDEEGLIDAKGLPVEDLTDEVLDKL